ncbi:MAG: preprotein translocase subunit SecE [Longimicrobiales bacterium]
MAVVDTFKNTKTFIDECWVELQKVTWPDRDQLQNATIVVIAFTIAISGIIWAMDGVVRVVVDQIMAIFGA